MTKKSTGRLIIAAGQMWCPRRGPIRRVIWVSDSPHRKRLVRWSNGYVATSIQHESFVRWVHKNGAVLV